MHVPGDHPHRQIVHRSRIRAPCHPPSHSARGQFGGVTVEEPEAKAVARVRWMAVVEDEQQDWKLLVFLEWAWESESRSACRERAVDTAAKAVDLREVGTGIESLEPSDS